MFSVLFVITNINRTFLILILSSFTLFLFLLSVTNRLYVFSVTIKEVIDITFGVCRKIHNTT